MAKKLTPAEARKQHQASGTTVVGTPGRNKLAKATREIYDELVKKHGMDPLEAMAEIGFNRENPVDVRLSALKEVASYGHAKAKPALGDLGNEAGNEYKVTKVTNILNLITQSLPDVIENHATTK
jgi:hypothetical protein